MLVLYRKTMESIEDLNAKRAIAAHLLEYQFGTEEAIEVLKNAQKHGDRVLKILSAFDLLKAGVDVKNSEDFLISQLKNEHSIGTILLYGFDHYVDTISDDFLVQIEKAIAANALWNVQKIC